VNKPETQIQWAPRVSREKILELYIKVASGNDDEELIDEVANAFYHRCSDLIRIAERRFACSECSNELPHPHSPNTDLACKQCGWRMDWKTFYSTFKGKQLSVNVDLTDVTRKFVTELPECKTPQAKMILIDAIIHACHAWISKGITYYGRPLAVNFIDGNMNQVIAFLENLPNGPDTLPEMTEQLMDWRKKVLSLFTDSEAEMDKVRYMVESMSPELRAEIIVFLKNRHQQKAANRLREIKEYAEELTIHKGDIAAQVVRLMVKERKEKTHRNRESKKSTTTYSTDYS
jgi:DNA-directed RNA polymerase subunit RPC12/RpoP